MRTLYACIFASMILAGCTHLQPPVSPQCCPDSNAAYAYGSLKVYDDSRSIFGKTGIALALVHEISGKTVYMGFREKGTTYAVKLKPGVYRIKKIVFLDHYNIIVSEKSLAVFGLDIRFTAEPNRLYYIGDYSGTAIWKWGFYQRWRWELNAVADHYAQTTSDLFAAFPALKHLATFDVLRLRGPSVSF